MPTGIPWCDEVINPFQTPDSGYHCTKVSEGCAHCYAERMNKRFGNGMPFDNTPTEFQLNYKQLYKPLHWEKPRRVFIQSMGDLFHEGISDELRDEVFSIVLACSVLNNRPHTFIVLTKRPELMKKYFTDRDPLELIKTWADRGDGHIQMDNPDICFSEIVYSATCRDWDKNGRNSSGSEHRPWGYLKKVWPLPNLWLGVTSENQARADERIPILLQAPAAVRFVSIEPMLGPVDLTKIPWVEDPIIPSDKRNALNEIWDPAFPIRLTRHKLDWVICGGESGPGARPMHPDWVRSLQDQCQSAATSFYFKQWGEWHPEFPERNGEGTCPVCNCTDSEACPGGCFWTIDKDMRDRCSQCVNIKSHLWTDGTYSYLTGKKRSGRLLDGREWLQMPELGV